MCDFKGCPKEHICNTTCPSGFDGDICNKMCNCTENQDCSSTIVCLKQNDSISISKTPLQYDPESIRVTGNIKCYQKCDNRDILLTHCLLFCAICQC